MTSEAQISLAMPPRRRSLDDILIHIRSQQDILRSLCNLACEFHDIDMRPLLFDGQTVVKLGPDPVPDELRALIQSEAATLRALEAEFVGTRDSR